MNSDINKKSSGELKHEVMGDLKKLNRDIDQLKDRLSPGQLIDDAIFYRNHRTPRATFDYLKQNPVGTSFLALGTILLMEDESNKSFETIAKDKTSGAIDSAKNSAADMSSGLRSKVDDVKSNIKSKLAGARVSDFQENSSESIESAKSKLSSKSKSIKEGVAARVPEIKEKASQGLDAAKSKAGQAAQSVKSSVKSIEPLTYVALGAGLGTLTGASFPLTQREEEFAENKLDEKISDFSNDLQNALNESANILKSEFLKDLSDIDLNIFGKEENKFRQSV